MSPYLDQPPSRSSAVNVRDNDEAGVVISPVHSIGSNCWFGRKLTASIVPPSGARKTRQVLKVAFGTFLAEEQARVLGQLPDGPQLAILAVPPIMDPGRFTQAVANNRGVRMRASDSLQELLSWLGV